MTWWYENEVEEMKLYKNEDLCIGCKNEFFSKPYDHRDPTPGQLGYCIKCDNCLIKEKKMEFLRERVFTSLNADELRAGDKVIVADTMTELKHYVKQGIVPTTLTQVLDEEWSGRFDINGHNFFLAYLVERKENCTNCACHCEVTAHPEIDRCENYKPKTEKHYRPFKDTDELVKVWGEKIGSTDYWGKGADLTMPHIWVKRKEAKIKGQLITEIGDDLYVFMGKEGYNMTDLFIHFTFLDGSPCGVEE